MNYKYTMKKGFTIWGLLLIITLNGRAQSDSLQTQLWSASWISVPGINPHEYGVYKFRKDFELNAIPNEFIVNVTGDNRYKLYVNEQIVSIGPARGDLAHWNYETVDIATYLHTGRNTVAALIWNEGKMRAEANISSRTAFLLQGVTKEATLLNTNHTWKCIQDKSYTPTQTKLESLVYLVTGPGEQVDMHKHIVDWKQTNISLDKWQNAEIISPCTPKEACGGISGVGLYADWMIQPSILKQRELKKERLQAVRQSTLSGISDEFLRGKTRVSIPAHTKTTILLDQEYLTNAYFTLCFSKGANSRISVSYQESLYTNYPHKGNRNEVKGKHFLGKEDKIISNGKEGQEFTTLAWRTYRYILLDIQTAAEALTLDEVYGIYTAYPFDLKAQVNTDNQELNTILDIGWRTAKLCAWETYSDCPYYEQLQYLGDTRIQMLITLYNAGDDAFIRNYLNLADASRKVEGVTLSRYPAKTDQYITPYALHYIWSLHDYMMYADEQMFVAGKLMSMRSILDYFRRFQQQDGRIKHLPGWNFTDWVDNENAWAVGVNRSGRDGNSSVLDLQLLIAYQLAADLEKHLGSADFARMYQERASALETAIHQYYWDESHGLYADRSEKDAFSQHVNALAIIAGLATGERAYNIAKKIETDQTLAPASIYFKYYTHRAMIMAGLGNNYMAWLDKWRENINMGLTTWGETSDVDATRSDCHAWGASPNIECYRTLLGIDSDSPAFKTIKIEPHLGKLKKIGGEIPHPNGKILVDYQVCEKEMKATIELPVHTRGRFVWNGKTYLLNTGKNYINTAETRYHSIKPGTVWLDTEGKPIQAHGFQILVKDSTYYWYGENKEYTVPGSSVWTYGIRCYKSTDFYNWEDCGLIIPPDTINPLSPLHFSQTLDRPHILFCKQTGKYVCWIKSMDEDGYFVILQSDNILGPYQYVRSLRPGGFGVGDFDLYADEDTGKGYVWFERPHWEMICAELSDDYTDVTERYSNHFVGMRPPYTREAPTHFVYKGKHYLFTSGTTGYFPNESLISTFDDYHGIYYDLGNPHPSDSSKTSFWSQITDVVKIPGRDLYIAVADRWMPQIVGTDDASREFERMKTLYQHHKPNELNFNGVLVKDKRNIVRTEWDVTYNATYVFLPIVYHRGMPQIVWKDEWRIEEE